MAKAKPFAAVLAELAASARGVRGNQKAPTNALFFVGRGKRLLHQLRRSPRIIAVLLEAGFRPAGRIHGVKEILLRRRA